MRNILLSEMDKYFERDVKRINHAKKVLGFAEEILKTEQGDSEIITAAAILHDIGIHAAEKKYGSTSGKYQEIEGPPIAGNILNKINFPKAKIVEVLEIIANHHSPGKIVTNNFKILYDADWLVNLREEHDVSNKTKLKTIIEKVFLTETGKKLAYENYD